MLCLKNVHSFIGIQVKAWKKVSFKKLEKTLRICVQTMRKWNRMRLFNEIRLFYINYFLEQYKFDWWDIHSSH